MIIRKYKKQRLNVKKIDMRSMATSKNPPELGARCIYDQRQKSLLCNLLACKANPKTEKEIGTRKKRANSPHPGAPKRGAFLFAHTEVRTWANKSLTITAETKAANFPSAASIRQNKFRKNKKRHGLLHSGRMKPQHNIPKGDSKPHPKRLYN